MNGPAAIRAALSSTKDILEWYVKDLSDADILVRPVPGANHTAWQLGHLIDADYGLVSEQLPDAKFPPLPDGFKDAHSTARASAEGSDGFLTKDEYVTLFGQVRKASMEAVASLTEADLDRPTIGSMAGFAPTLGDLLLMVATHTLMHAGQVTVLRRKLGKPILF